MIAWAASAAAAAAATLAAMAPVIAIAAAIAALAAGIIYAYTHWDWFKTAVDAVAHFLTDILWPALKAIVDFIDDHVVPVIQKLIGWYIQWIEFQLNVVRAVGGAIADIAGFFADLAGHVFGFATKFWEFVNNMRQQLAEWVMSVWQNGAHIVEFFRSLPGQILGFFEGLAETIMSPFRSAFNAIASMWNRTVGSLSFEVPGWIPGLGGHGWNVPNIPEWAKGGVAQKGLAWVGEKGPELVNFGSPSRVFNHEESMQMLAGGGDVTVTQHFHIGTVTRENADYLAQVAKFRLERELGVSLRGAVG
jgi:hypothetical protein